MINQIVLMGNLTGDPERTETRSGTPVAYCRLAVDRDFINADGIRETDFFDVTAYNKTAEHMLRYFRKGQAVIVTGAMQCNRWEDQNGTRRESWKVVAQRTWFGDRKAAGPAPEEDEGMLPS